MKAVIVALRFAPSLLCGLLLATWAVSVIAWIEIKLSPPTRWYRGIVGIGCGNGTLAIWHNQNAQAGVDVRPLPLELYLPRSRWAGEFSCGSDPPIVAHVWLPIPVLLTLVLPLALGPFIRFRFPLWSWFAWTTLVALECGYYLR